MTRSALVALLLCSLTALPGCAISRVYVGPRDAPTGEVHRYTTFGFFWNIVPASPVNAAGECSDGVQRVAMRRGFLSVVVNYLTVGIVIPTQVTVDCLKSGQ